MNVQKAAGWITSVGGAVAVLATGLNWAWNTHNQFLMDTISPLLRASYVSRINNYRKMECKNELSPEAHESMLDVMQDYEELVGRPISSRECDSL